VEVVLASKNRSFQAVRRSHFRLRHSTAMEIDFIFVWLPPPWWTFGFSTTQESHRTVSHITIGTDEFFPDRTTEYVMDGISCFGFKRQARPRSYSN
jgi:hypothetical protein